MSNLYTNLQQGTFSNNEENALEDNYQKTFPKIARDFITREELRWILNNIFNAINNVNPELGNALYENFSNLENMQIAINKSNEYTVNQQLPDTFKRKYEDIK
jgi:hypothetical protein